MPWVDALAAAGLLTRLPVAQLRRGDAPPDLARAVWAFPLVGLAVGGLAALVYWMLARLGAPPMLAAVWTLATAALTTGALHEDGLADFADGLGGGNGSERKLEIMRDSRIGVFGALALVFSSLLRVGAIAAIASPERVLIALCVAGALGRAAIIVALMALTPARENGLAASMARVPVVSAALALVIVCVASFTLLPVHVAAILFAASAVTIACIVHLAHKHIGGYTGDVLGALEVVVECVALTAIASAFA
jgi:adenosylcobinamide-GDP ribazoletransferase